MLILRKHDMNTSINNIRALCTGFHDSDIMGRPCHLLPSRCIGLFYCQMPVQLVPILSIPQWSIEGLLIKVKHLTEFNGTTTAKPIKESYKLHLLKPYALECIGGFCSRPKGTSWAGWLHDTRRFIKRWCFL